jgi:secreted trypsin-like serine protease
VRDSFSTLAPGLFSMLALFPVILALSLPLSDPIIRRSDRPDSAYCNLGSQARALVSIGRDGDGTLIGGRWVLTAAHVAKAVSDRDPVMRSVEIEGVTYPVEKTFVHPEWTERGAHDIALLYLSRPVVGVIPALLYRDTSEAGLIATVLGHGQTGTGANENRVDDGKARGATSRVDSVDSQWLYFSFDSPPSGTELEGAPGAGDSGGPAIIVIDKMPFVAGVSSAGYDGVTGPGSYGAVDVFTRVSTNADWIDKVMTATSAPSTPSSRRSSGRGTEGQGGRGRRR